MKNSFQSGLCLLAMLVFSVGVFAQDSLADNMLVYQRSVGGWPKHISNVKVDYTKSLTPDQKTAIQNDKLRKDATIDNGATTKEIRYLVKAFAKTGNRNYLSAAEKGVRYLLTMQYENGGFPQFFPDTSIYRSQVTYNDNAMINALNILWDVAHRTAGFDVFDVSLQKPAAAAIDKGIDCILRTQIMVKGKLTGWCSQYNRRTLQPENARSFELVSISGMESVGIVKFLMKIESPSPVTQKAITSAIDWFIASKIAGFKYVDVEDASKPKGKDRIIQPDASSTIWARFYDIETNKPFFTGRDGKKKWDLMEIDHERRIGYAWYGTWPAELLEKEYPKWKAKNKIL